MSPAPPPPPPKRPYLLRAMHQWMSDSGHTPHVIVDAERAGAEVPKAYVKEGKIVLNLSPSATQRLKLGNDEIEFDAREARIEFDFIITQLQPLRRARTEIEDDLAFLDVGLGNLGTSTLGIDDHVGCMSAVGHPLVHGSQQVRALGRRRRGCWRHGATSDEAHFLLGVRQAFAKRRARKDQARVLDDRLRLW